ncbi:hypothetical protein PPL_09625 [Heterostelium album PN500]|uniref:U-box domain-containing protein n=1 Tax=Heterostelium pallidum (strain ATCC 26659 / Pp 5 / PN500) TaxID=670386 RepID=D3BNV4_HETP5|nr:hypothetical protein PPL_09625 [Heterostelium album PN500]EFA76873.1 hypothetical protein PPL_09625 [Heterostelium album PN500]|eukprot:XP_020429005.1 hypothetical protein PPL_09625 [Heterostelium album PN500]
MDNNFDEIFKKLSQIEVVVVPPVFLPIGVDSLVSPLYSPYGHIFERSKIESWLEKHSICPITREPLSLEMLKPVIFVSEDENILEKENESPKHELIQSNQTQPNQA